MDVDGIFSTATSPTCAHQNGLPPPGPAGYPQPPVDRALRRAGPGVRFRGLSVGMVGRQPGRRFPRGPVGTRPYVVPSRSTQSSTVPTQTRRPREHHRARCTRSRRAVLRHWGDGPAAFAPGESQSRPGERVPPQDNAAEQSVLGGDAALQGRHRRRGREVRGHRLLPPGPRDRLRRHPRPLRSRRARRPGHRGRRAATARRAASGSAGRRTSTRSRPTCRSPPTPATTPRSCARRRSCAGWSTPAPGSSSSATPARARSTTSSTARRPRSTTSPTAHRRGLRAAVRHHGRRLDEIEAIGNRDGRPNGVPTGFADLDDLTNGLHAGQMIIVAARPAMGKALALDTPLPTPTAGRRWARCGRRRAARRRRPPDPGVAATEVMHDRPCYEVDVLRRHGDRGRRRSTSG